MGDDLSACGWAGASLGFYAARPSPAAAVVAGVALAAATGIVAWIGARTVRHMLTGAAFRED